MATLFTQRSAQSLTLSLRWSARSKNYTLSFATAERRTPRHSLPLSRSFTFRPPLHQQAAAKTTSPAAAPPKPAAAAGATRPPTTARAESKNPPQPPIQDISKTGLADSPGKTEPEPDNNQVVDWTTSFHGLSTASFAPDVAKILLEPLSADDIEVKPDGIVYLPEIKYRRILNRAFGPGGWGLAPRGETIVTSKSVTREYALLAHGRLVSIARGEQDYFDADGIPTATEGCKSNALMRCCKDLGIASELWDPRFLRRFMKEHARDVWVEHVVNKKKRKITIRKDDEPRYPYALSKPGAA